MSSIIQNWKPEDNEFWESTGKKIANRNLWISVPCLLLAFAVWMVWSVVVINLSNIGFEFSSNQLFWLAALPGLSGATLRVFYSFMVPIFGGRRWTTLSTASLLLPTIGIGLAVQDTNTSYSVFVILALLCGFGGGNFASSMANISFFYPKAQKGYALGINAGLGNLGVSVVQFVVPIVITAGLFGALGGESQTWTKDQITKPFWLQNAGFFWVPFIAFFSITAWVWMNDLADAKSSFKEQAVIFKRKHNWLMCWLYTGTFGSFIGYSAAFPLLIKTQFPDVNATDYAFLGPLVGALARVVGGPIADKLGGAKVTFWVFLQMAVSVVGVIYFLPQNGQGGNFWAFLAMFMLLFAGTGVGNASTFRMIPVIFMRICQSESEKGAEEQAHINGNKEGAAVLGFTSAIAAYGAFFIPKSFGASISTTGAVNTALWFFIAFYLTCIVMTWWYYSRKNAQMPC